MESRFSDLFFHLSILHAGVLPPPLLKRELEHKIAEELRRPPDRPKEDHHHKKEDKKHAAASAKSHEAHLKSLKPVPKPGVPKKAAAKPAPKKASKPRPRLKPKAKSKPAKKKKKR
jgi:hypothetical protein